MFFEIVYCVYWASFKRCLVGDYERWITRSKFFCGRVESNRDKKKATQVILSATCGGLKASYWAINASEFPKTNTAR